MVMPGTTGAILEREVRESDSAETGLESSEADAVVVPLVGAQPPGFDQATPLLKDERPRQLELQNQVVYGRSPAL